MGSDGQSGDGAGELRAVSRRAAAETGEEEASGGEGGDVWVKVGGVRGSQ